jgi:teichuronic acid biosynthesis glycosyltransferase TuaG
MSNANSHLVSIVVPVYNAARFIDETIKTVLDQTYTNWEILLVDDKSTDESVKIIKPYAAKDKRIKLFSNKQNSGAAISRNKGIDTAKGRYIAFLDADDLWLPSKLEKQVAFMQKQDCAFSFTGYEFADKNGKPNGKKVHVPATITYKQALKNTTISTITVMCDVTKLSKAVIHMPNIRRGQDTATWWKILKTIDSAYGLDEVLSYYRRTPNSLSANKYKALKRTWYLYINVEKIHRSLSAYLLILYIINATKRRI